MSKILGSTFGAEVLSAFGGPLNNIVWGGDASSITGRDTLSAAQNTLLDSVIAAHDPAKLPVPGSVTALQARRALRAAGLYDSVVAQVNAASSTNPDVLDSFTYAAEWVRDASWIASLGPALGLTPAQIDDLFRQAATL